MPAVSNSAPEILSNIGKLELLRVFHGSVEILTEAQISMTAAPDDTEFAEVFQIPGRNLPCISFSVN
jgi:hypothetical protein